MLIVQPVLPFCGAKVARFARAGTSSLPAHSPTASSFSATWWMGWPSPPAPIQRRAVVMGQNLIVEATLPAVTMRKLSEEEMNHYRAPFPDRESRRAMARLPREWPFAGDPIDTAWVITKYSEWLKESDTPKLLIHATPGLFVTPENAAWAANNFKNIDTLDLGAGIWMLMEDNPHEIGEGIVKWFKAKVE